MMSAVDLLPLVLVLPLAGVVMLVLAGRWLSDRVAGWLATALVGLVFLLSVGIGIELRPLRAEGPGVPGNAPPPVVHQTLWRWISAGEDLVEVTIARRDLPPLQEIPADAVGRAWMSLDTEGLVGALPHMWDPDAVAGQRPMDPEVVPIGSVLTDANVPPPGTGLVVAAPRRQQRFSVDASLQLDGLSLFMMLVVTGVGFLLHLYSIGYMDGDPDVRCYFAYLNLFVFSMLVLVLGANFLVLFVGWELVGLCSYLLIGFWFTDRGNADAGRKAFIVNRVGDFAFLIGLMLIWTTFGSLAYSEVLPAAAALLPRGSSIPVAIAALLLIGATGKSAQVPLFVWLPDAMAGPTPVSALIHAATMVTAGVYMIARTHLLFEQAPVVLAVVAVLGALTALLAAIIALVQVDIKRVLAYSTISQLGFMFMAVGAGAYAAGLFHLMAHAFFKALLFLCAGSIMHAMEHGLFTQQPHPQPAGGVPPHQDMRRMGGLLSQAPLTGWSFVVGGLALAGIFPLAGFWSKDEIFLAVLAHERGVHWLWPALWAVGVVTAFLTALYIGRVLFMTLVGQPRSEGARNARRYEQPLTMAVPLAVLAILTLVGGGVGVSLGNDGSILTRLLGPVVGPSHHEGGPSGLVMAIMATSVAASALAFAWLAYGPRRVVDPERISTAIPWAYRLAWRKFYVDEIYGVLFVRPWHAVSGFLWHVVDDRLVDGAANAVGRWFVDLGQWLRRHQTGYVRQYALSMLIGAVLTVLYLFLRVR